MPKQTDSPNNGRNICSQTAELCCAIAKNIPIVNNNYGIH